MNDGSIQVLQFQSFSSWTHCDMSVPTVVVGKGVGRNRQGGPWPLLARKFFHFDHWSDQKSGFPPPWKLKSRWRALPWSPREPSPGKIPAYALGGRKYTSESLCRLLDFNKKFEPKVWSDKSVAEHCLDRSSQQLSVADHCLDRSSQQLSVAKHCLDRSSQQLSVADLFLLKIYQKWTTFQALPHQTFHCRRMRNETDQYTNQTIHHWHNCDAANAP